MKKWKQQTIAFAFTIVLMASLLPFSAVKAAETSGVQVALDEILRDYPNGSFFTKNGSACTHGITSKCNNCSLVQICNATGKKLSAGQADAWTCQAFVDYEMNQVFGLNITQKMQVGERGRSTNASTFQNAKIGDLIYFYRLKDSKGPAHVAICMGITNDSITLYECNATGHVGEVSYRTIPYAQMKSYHNYNFCGVFRANNYDKINSTAQPISPTYVTVTFDPNGGTVSPNTQKIVKGSDPRNLPIPVRKGYTFKGWMFEKINPDNPPMSSSGGMLSETSAWGFNEDTTVYAYWSKDSAEKNYYVTLDDGSTCKQITVTFGGTYSGLTTPSKDGYTFDGWYTKKTGGSKVTSSTKVSLTSDQTLYAHWIKNPHTHVKTNPIISPDHPHYTFYTCTCGEVFTNNETNYVASCSTCALVNAGQSVINGAMDTIKNPTSSPSGHWGDWYDWTTTPIYPIEGFREVETREVEQRVKISDGYTEYRYGGYVTSDGNHECWCDTYLRNKFGSASLRYSAWSATRYSANGSSWSCGQCNGNHVNVDHHTSDGRSWWGEYTLPGGKNYYWEEIRTVAAQYETRTVTEYRFRNWMYD